MRSSVSHSVATFEFHFPQSACIKIILHVALMYFHVIYRLYPISVISRNYVDVMGETVGRY